MITLTSIYSLAICAVGMGMVYLGVAFLNGLLLPSIFAPLYHISSHSLVRVIVAFPLFFGPANYLVGVAYKIGGATVGGVGSLLFTVVWMTTMAVIVDQAKVNLWILGGAAVCIVGCLLVVHGIKMGTL